MTKTTLATFFLIFFFIFLYVLGFRLVIVLTDSMSPTMPPLSLAFVAPTSIVKPTNRSIVLFKFFNHLVLHRVVRMEGNKVMTKGDNRNFVECSRIDDVVGVVVFSIPHAPLVYAFIFALFITSVVKEVLQRNEKK